METTSTTSEGSPWWKRATVRIKGWAVTAGVWSFWRFVDLLTIPSKTLSAIFYTTIRDGKSHEVVDRYFSITRALYIFSTVILMFRLSVGGSSMNEISFGKQVEWKAPSSSATKSHSRKKRKVAKAAAVTTVSKSRPWLHFSKVEFKPLTFAEIFGYIVIVLLYYFSGSISRGDSKGMFSEFLERLSLGYAVSKGIAVQPTPVAATPTVSPPGPVPQSVSTGESSKRKKRGSKVESVPEIEDPFLK